jgi:NAD+ synthase
MFLNPNIRIGCSGWQYRHGAEFFVRPSCRLAGGSTNTRSVSIRLPRRRRHATEFRDASPPFLPLLPLQPYNVHLMPTAERIAGWMRRQLAATGARGFIVGLSGGIDSALVARLGQLAAPGAVVGAILPCHSDPDDERAAALVASHFALPTVRVDLSAAYDALVVEVQPPLQKLPEQIRATTPADPLRGRVPLANMKPRLRMTALYFFANTLNYLVAGTGNRSELSIGYFSKYGDGGVDLLPIGRLVKSEVRTLARELNVPATIIERTPSAGLWLGQTDEDEMGFTYAELERYLDDGPQGVSPALAMRIERLTRAGEHKLSLPPMPDAE